MPDGSRTEDREDQAAMWLSRLRSSEGNDWRATFDAWREHPENAVAFERLLDVWEAAGALKSSDFAPARHWDRRKVLAGGVAALCVVGGGATSAVMARGTVYRTGLGEIRRFTLADGTRMTLDTSSEVRARFGGSGRHIDLHRGQASFRVSAAPQPFVIRAARQRITVDHADVNVRLDPDLVRVVLMVGTARIDTGDGPTRHVRAGESLVDNGQLARVERVDPDDATAWQDGRLNFRADTLTRAVEEMNRYGPTPLAVAPDVAALRVSGSYRVGDSRAFAQGLAALLPVRVRQDGPRLLLYRA